MARHDPFFSHERSFRAIGEGGASSSCVLGGLPARTAILALIVMLFPGTLLAGPPFLTDDPEPVDYGHWEINNFTSSVFAKGTSYTAAPGSDINYGILPNVQAHVNVAVAASTTTGLGTSYGPADLELGVKYRFIEAKPEDWWPQIAIYPFLDLPVGDASRGLGTGSVHAFLPLWLQKDFGKWTVYGGGGYWINPGADNRNWWYTGAVLLRQITDNLQLGGEIFHQTVKPERARCQVSPSAPKTRQASISAALTISIRPITYFFRQEEDWRMPRAATSFLTTSPCESHFDQ